MRATEFIKLAKTKKPELTYGEHFGATFPEMAGEGVKTGLKGMGAGAGIGAGVGTLGALLNKSLGKSLAARLALLGGTGTIAGAGLGSVAALPWVFKAHKKGEKKGLKGLHAKYPELKTYKGSSTAEQQFSPLPLYLPYKGAKRHIEAVRATKKGSKK